MMIMRVPSHITRGSDDAHISPLRFRVITIGKREEEKKRLLVDYFVVNMVN